MTKTPEQKAIEWIARIVYPHLNSPDPLAEAGNSDFCLDVAADIIKALPVEWIDSESEPEVGDVIEYYYDPCDLRATIYDGDTNWLKVQSYWRIIQRKNRPAINVDEINLSKVE